MGGSNGHTERQDGQDDAATGVMRLPDTGSVPIGRYALEVGAQSHSVAQFADVRPPGSRGQARKNAAALRSALAEPDEPTASAPLLDTVERAEGAADEVTDRVEHANRIFKAAVSGQLEDRRFLTSEADALLGLLGRLDREGRYQEELRVARAAHGLCALAFRWVDLIRSLLAALRAAKAAGDNAGQAWAHNELGALHLCAGNATRAEEHLQRAIELQESLGDAAGRCATRRNLDHARRDRARPIQMRRPRRVTVVACAAAAAIVFLGAGKAALGWLGGTSVANGASKATLTVSTQGAPGRVTGAGIRCVATCREQVSISKLVRLKAVPRAGYAFVRWQGADCRRGPLARKCTFRMHGSMTAVAVFARHAAPTALVRVGVDGQGSVSGPGVDCPSDCAERFRRGAAVTLMSVPDAGSSFQGWSGVDCERGSAAASCTIRVEGPVRAVAQFSDSPATTWTLGVAVDGGGSVAVSGVDCGTGCQRTVADGASVTLTAAANDGWQFEGWRGSQCRPGSAPTTCTVTMRGNVTEVAVFSQQAPATSALGVAIPGGGGSVTGGGIDCGTTCDAAIDTGTTVTLTATPATGWVFLEWKGVTCSEGDQSGTDCTFPVQADTSVTAVFNPAIK